MFKEHFFFASYGPNLNGFNATFNDTWKYEIHLTTNKVILH